MAIEREVKIKIDTKQADKDVQSLNDELNELGEVGQESGEKASKGIDEVGKSAKSTETASKGASLGVKAIGTALKAIGIGLILALFAKFVQVLTENRKVADGLSIVFGTVSNVIQQIVGGLVDAVTAVYDATDGFSALGKVMSGLFTLAITPLKGGFLAIQLALQSAQLAWEQSFFGDDDPETIKRLNAEIKQTQKDIAQTAIEAVKAGQSVADNFGAAVSEVSSLGEAAINNLSKVSLTAAFEQSKTTVELKNNAALAEAQLQGIVEKYDRQAEQLRQIRDDEKRSISDRIKANEDLGKVLDEQAKAQKALAGVRVALAKQELALNKGNVEAQKAVIEAQNEVLAIEATVEGLRSEQLINRNSLLKEQAEILKELNEIGKSELELAKQEQEVLLEERRARIELQVEDEQEKFRLLAEARKDFDRAIAEIDQAETDRLAKIEQERTENEKAQAKAREEIAQAEADAKQATINKTGQVIEQFGQIAGEQAVLGKGLSAASATINTFQGVSDALAAKTITPFETALKFANAAAIGIAGAKNVANILKVQIPGFGSGGGSPDSGLQTAASGGQQAPAFNLTASSGVNQIGGDVQGSQPVRAFVVGSDVTSQQEMDRATFGQAGI